MYIYCHCCNPRQIKENMKITKSQLKEMISQVVHDNLNKGLEADDIEEPGMSRDELAAHLAAERDRKRCTDVQRRRADMRRSVRGMELESSHDVQENVSGQDHLESLRGMGWDDTEILEELVKSMSGEEAAENFNHIKDMFGLSET